MIKNSFFAKFISRFVFAGLFFVVFSITATGFAAGFSGDMVLGRDNFTSSTFNNLDNNDLYYPSSAAVVVSGKLIVADSSNNRILVYNSIPASSNASADVVIGQLDFNTNTSGCSAVKLNNPAGVASDGTRLFIADYNNNRVLVYNTIPVVSGAAANIVIGQANFTTGASGTSQTKLYNPSSVASDGARLFIADYSNHRVLVYNTIPVSSGAPADFVIGQTDWVSRTTGTSQTKLNYPYSVCAATGKLFIADRNNSRVLVFNSIPISNGAAADIVTGQPDFITSAYGTTQSKMYYPTGVYSDGTRIFVSDSYNHRILIYNTIPAVNGVLANLVIGQANFTTKTSGTSQTKLYYPNSVYVNGAKLFISDKYNHRVLIYNSLPALNGASADVVLGHVAFTNGTPNDTDAAGLYNPSRSCIAAGRLFVADPGNNRVLIYNTIPFASGALADLVIGQTTFNGNSAGTTQTTLRSPSAVYCDGTKVYIADTGNNRILVYNTIPVSSGAPASVVIGQSVFTSSTAGTSQTGLRAPRDIYADTRLYIADSSNNRVLIYNIIPTSNGAAASVVVGQPDFTTSAGGISQTKMSSPYGIFSDGTKLFTADTGNNRVLIYNTIPTSNGAAASVVTGQPDFITSAYGTSSAKLYSPNKVFVPQGSSRMYIADSNNHRLLIYNLPPAVNGALADKVAGQDVFTTRTSGASSSKFNYPGGVFTYGARLYISDYNNNRIIAGQIPNIAPVLNLIGDKTQDAGNALQFSVSASDADNDVLVYSVSNLPQGAAFDPLTKIFSWTPSYAQAGTYPNVRFKVSDGISEDYKDIKITINQENVPPTGAVTINAGVEFTNQRQVMLGLTASDAESGMGEGAQMRFSDDNVTWSSPEPYAQTKSWQVPLGEGEKTIYVKFKDVAGNWSSAFSDTITLDETAPNLLVNPVSTPTNQDVHVSYSAFDNWTPSNEIEIKGDNSPYTAEGNYDLTLTAKDKAGNVSTERISFVIDKTPPAIVITSPENGEVVESAQVTLSGTIDGASFSETRTLQNEGENILTRDAVDPAGNNSAVSISVTLYTGQLIGPEGGEVISPDGKVRLVIPAGALNEPARIKILTVKKETLQGATPDGSSLLSVVECKPYGLVFNKPALITYTLYQAEIPGTPVELGLYDSLQKKIIPTGQTSTVPIDGYNVTFSITHFSTYAALKNLVPQSAPIGGAVKIPLPDMLTGAFGHSIPITVIPGRKGMQPNLSLAYHSSGPNSWVGMGFGLNPGYIVRSTRLGPPKYIDIEDTFYFITDSGTTELVHLADNLYQAKIESAFTRFFKEADDSWRIVGKDGGVGRFGQTEDSKEISDSGTFGWYLTEALDTNGNYIEYSYTKDEGKAYLSRIAYTGNKTGLSPANHVDFILEPRDDIYSSYISTAKIKTAKRLKEIQVKAGSDLVWRYVLEYALSLDTGRSVLKAITQYGADGKSLPTQEFIYQRAK